MGGMEWIWGFTALTRSFEHDIKLRTDNAVDPDRLARRHPRTGFASRRGGVARTGLDIGDLAHALLRDRSNHGGAEADQGGDTRFAGTLRLTEDLVEDP